MPLGVEVDVREQLDLVEQETIIGFVAGYLTGAKQGRDGLDRPRTTLRDMAQSPEARRMAADAMAIAGAIVSRGGAREAPQVAKPRPAVSQLLREKIRKKNRNTFRMSRKIDAASRGADLMSFEVLNRWKSNIVKPAKITRPRTE